ncbi:hypothetical protein F908_00423 [Acinetobacter sp. NIPH 284]|nr:hypothetical protein F908_00423 [Acinetobacter sp. NIPH 284]
MGKALDAEERLHVCFTINASIISVKHFTRDLFHFRYLFKMRCNSLKCVIIFVVRKQVLCHYFNELSFFVVYKDQNVKVLDSGARGSLTTFAERGIGDVLLSWENEALLATQGLGKDKYDIVYPSISILAEPSVAIVDKTVDKDGNRNLARGYLNFLYSPLGQELAAKHYFRPRNPQVAAKYAKQFPKIKLFSINDVFGGWAKAQKNHFVNGAIFDQIYADKQ